MGQILRRGSQVGRQLTLVETSPLRHIDPRVKLLMASSASLVVMFTLEKLVIFLVIYTIFLAWARLLPLAARQVWRIKGLLLFLFIIDYVFIDVELAIVVTLRLILLAGVFTLLVATTTPIELSLALEKMRLPYRYAFSMGLAFQSMGLLEEEWHMIQEAQRARGAFFGFNLSSWRQLTQKTRDLLALSVPAIVMTTKRAWSITEAAYARGFDSPHRHPAKTLVMKPLDWLYALITILTIALLFWR